MSAEDELRAQVSHLENELAPWREERGALIREALGAAAQRDKLRATVKRIETLVDEWTSEARALARNPHGARDVHEAAQLEQCALEVRSALRNEP